MKTFVSVVMATYNGRKYISRQLNSICNQSRLPDEVLIFDDCSTDDTVCLVKQFVKERNLKNWHVIKNENNLGWKANFAQGIARAKGDIVFLSDQDDVWDADKIEVMCKNMEEHPGIGVLACNYEPVYESENAPKILTPYGQYGKNHLQKVELSGKTFRPIRPGCCFSVRREVIEEFNKLWFEGCPHDSMLWGIGLIRRNLFILNEVHHRFYRTGENNTPLLKRNSRKERINNLKFRKKLANLYLEQMHDVPMREHTWLSNYSRFADKRIAFMNSGSIFQFMRLIRYWSYYPKIASWVGDYYAYVKSR